MYKMQENTFVWGGGSLRFKAHSGSGKSLSATSTKVSNMEDAFTFRDLYLLYFG